VSMAGERLQVSNYTEISAVCTHPDHPGKGYARRLLLLHINRLLSASRIPFLHVKKDNLSAIGLYESVGFKTSRLLHVLMLRKK
jgi:predicted GNAT family acetyltransferase